MNDRIRANVPAPDARLLARARQAIAALRRAEAGLLLAAATGPADRADYDALDEETGAIDQAWDAIHRAAPAGEDRSRFAAVSDGGAIYVALPEGLRLDFEGDESSRDISEIRRVFRIDRGRFAGL